MDFREADESRLREVCESFLGPPTGMIENTTLHSQNLAWDPCVLVSPTDACGFEDNTFSINLLKCFLKKLF